MEWVANGQRVGRCSCNC